MELFIFFAIVFQLLFDYIVRGVVGKYSDVHAPGFPCATTDTYYI